MGKEPHHMGIVEEERGLPARPVTYEQGYLAAILEELRAIRAAVTPPGGEPEEDLFRNEPAPKKSKEGQGSD
jgi:hypothetical protein